jgi:hypothetical protein
LLKKLLLFESFEQKSMTEWLVINDQRFVIESVLFFHSGD